MTPDEARRLLDNFDRLLPFEAELEMEGAAKDMAAMIAGMREECGVMYEYSGDGQPAYFYRWTDIYDAPLDHYAARRIAERKKRDGYDNVRIVRRYVTNEEEA